MLTVIEEMPLTRLPSGQVNRVMKCRCDCGKEKEVKLLHLVRLRIRSCGCIQQTLNGESGTPLCKVWKAMMERCGEKGIDNHRYFHRGITVCEEWKNYFTFKEWALANGWKKNLEIDRENNDGNYEPSNCRFVTQIVNVNNRNNTLRVDYKGEKIAFTLLLRKKKIKKLHWQTIRGRLARGWSGAEAIDTPIRKGNYGKKSLTNAS